MNSTETKVILTADDRTKQAFDAVTGSLNRLKGLAGGLGLGAAFSTAGIGAFVKTSIDAADRLNDLKDTTRLSIEQLNGLQLAAKIGGTDLETLAGAVSKLSVNIGKNGDDFKKLGISTKDPIEALKGLSDIFKNIEDPYKRAAFANQAFGKSWQEIAPLLEMGSAEIDRLVKKGQEYNKITPEMADQASKFNDQLDEMNQYFAGIGTTLASKALPQLNEFLAKTQQVLLASNIKSDNFFTNLFADTSFDTSNLDAQIDEHINNIAKMKTSYENLDPGKSFAKKLNDFVSGDRDTLKKQIDIAELELKRLEALKKSIQGPSGSTGEVKKTTANVEGFIKTSGGGSKSTGKSDAEKAAEDVAKLIKNFQDATTPAQTLTVKLQGQLEAYRNLDPNVQKYLQGLIDTQRATDELTKSTEAWAEQERLNMESDQRQLDLDEEQAAVEENRVKSLESQAQALREMIDPSYKLLEVIAEYQELLGAGLITQEEYDAAIKKSTETMDESTKKQKDGVDEMKRAIEGWGNEAADVFLDTDKNFGDLIDSMLEDLAKLAFKRSVTDPIFGALDDILSSFDSSKFESSGLDFSSFDFSSIFGGFFANGGTPPMNKISIVGERGPELFVPKSSGTIVPLTKANSDGSGGVIVNVVNNANGAKATATERSEGGLRIIDVVVEQVESRIAGSVSRGKGPVPEAMERKYGLNPAVGALR